MTLNSALQFFFFFFRFLCCRVNFNSWLRFILRLTFQERFLEGIHLVLIIDEVLKQFLRA